MIPMKSEIVGREAEIKILQKLLVSEKPELLAIYGRRRIGKTYLIKSYYKDNLVFSCSGQQDGKTQEQLVNFTEQINFYFPGKKILLAPKTWQEAFVLMKAGIDSIPHKKKKVIFF